MEKSWLKCYNKEVPATSPVTHINPISGKGKNGTIGLPLPDTDAKIVDRKKDLIISAGMNIYPREVEFVSELPKSTVGKVLKRVLRDEELKKRQAQKS